MVLWCFRLWWFVLHVGLFCLVLRLVFTFDYVLFRVLTAFIVCCGYCLAVLAACVGICVNLLRFDGLGVRLRSLLVCCLVVVLGGVGWCC